MATITFTTTFNLTTTPKKFTFVDTSDYAGQSISTVGLFGKFNITSPSGVIIYNNTTNTSPGCDIDVDSSTTNQLLIQLPLGLDGYPESGLYTIVYTVYSTDLTADYTAVTNTVTYDYTSPVIEIEQTVDCVSPLFTSTDITDYNSGTIIPVKDESHAIYYPNGSAGMGSPTTGTGVTVTSSTFYNGTQTTIITSDLTYTFTDGLIIVDSVTGSLEVVVDCTDTCAIYCCVRSIEQQMIAYSTTNTALYNVQRTLFSQIMGLVGMVMLARGCGKGTDISGYLNSIKLLANCTDDCSCTGDEPTQVYGLGGLVNNVVVTGTGEPIVVTAVTVGNTTTYNVALASYLTTLINSLYNTQVVAGTNMASVTSATVGLVTTFTVNGLAASTILVVDGESASTAAQSITSSSYVAITGATLTVPSQGTYLFWGELAIEIKADSKITVSYHVNGAQTGLARVWGAVQVIAGAVATYSFCLNEEISCGTSDVITIQIKRDVGADPVFVRSQSMIYLKKP